jgi:hypothetical protein
MSLNTPNTGARQVVYVDISSTNRNRTTYPSQFDFVIPTQQSNNTNNSALTAQDPVSLAYPTTGATLPPGQNVTGTSTSETEIVLDAATETTIENYYVNQYLEINGVFALITAYNPSTFTATLATALPSIPSPGTIYYTRQALPVFTGSVQTSVLNTTSQFVVASNALLSHQSNSYANTIVWFLPNQSTIGNNALAVPLPLVSYTPSTRLIVVQGNFPSVPQAGDVFEIEPFSFDNATPLLSFKGLGSNQAAGGRCELELLYLIVPNTFLSSGYNGDFTSYPFLYLQIFNDGMNSTTQVMYSNNPFTQKVIFKIPVNEYSGDKSFICLKDAKQKQTVSIRFDQDLRFTLTDPAGNTIATLQSDTESPASPNPLLQVSAMFAVRNV